MEHRLLTGGYEFLPFARSCVAKLKKLGLPYADQSFEIGGVSIKVRIEPGHEYITMSGGLDPYLVFPQAYNDMVFYISTVGILRNRIGVGVRVKRYSAEAGPTDWQGVNGDTVTYNNGFPARYRITRTRDNSSAGFDLYVNGRMRDTGGRKVMGAALFSFMADDGRVKRIPVIAQIITFRVLRICAEYEDIGWQTVGQYTIPSDMSTSFQTLVLSGVSVNSWYTLLADPVYFSPSGASFSTITTVMSPWSEGPSDNIVWQLSRIVRGAITWNSDGGNTRLSVSFTVSEPWGNLREHIGVANTPKSGESLLAVDYTASGAEVTLSIRRTFNIRRDTYIDTYTGWDTGTGYGRRVGSRTTHSLVDGVAVDESKDELLIGGVPVLNVSSIYGDFNINNHSAGFEEHWQLEDPVRLNWLAETYDHTGYAERGYRYSMEVIHSVNARTGVVLSSKVTLYRRNDIQTTSIHWSDGPRWEYDPPPLGVNGLTYQEMPTDPAWFTTSTVTLEPRVRVALSCVRYAEQIYESEEVPLREYPGIVTETFFSPPGESLIIEGLEITPMAQAKPDEVLVSLDTHTGLVRGLLDSLFPGEANLFPPKNLAAARIGAGWSSSANIANKFNAEGVSDFCFSPVCLLGK